MAARVSPFETVVDLGARSYPVHVRAGLDGLGSAVASTTGASRVALVTEEHVHVHWTGPAVAALHAGGVSVDDSIVLPAGEAAKSVEVWSSCVDALLAAGVDRTTPVVALGGGSLGDVAGFAAATVMRGVPLVQVPTTVLAMVDSSVGGKTAVNHVRGKNLVGAFHQPTLVWAALDTLTTLAPRELRSGLAEAAKMAVLGDAELFAAMERDATRLGSGDPGALAPIIARCVALKAEVVRADEREAGRRAVLNLGHTLGHALEHTLGYGELLHGEAVAIGLVAEATFAAERGLTAPAVPARIASLLAALGLPTQWPAVRRDALRRAVTVDKKVRGDMVVLPVSAKIGAVTLVHVPWSELVDRFGVQPVP